MEQITSEEICHLVTKNPDVLNHLMEKTLEKIPVDILMEHVHTLLMWNDVDVVLYLVKRLEGEQLNSMALQYPELAILFFGDRISPETLEKCHELLTKTFEESKHHTESLALYLIHLRKSLSARAGCFTCSCHHSFEQN